MPAETNPASATLSWRHELLRLALRQGSSFVILLLLLASLGQLGRHLVLVGLPAHLEQIKAGYREIQQAHNQNLERLLTTFQHEQDRLQEAIDLMRQWAERRELLEQNQVLLRDLAEHIQQMSNTNRVPQEKLP